MHAGSDLVEAFTYYAHRAVQPLRDLSVLKHIVFGTDKRLQRETLEFGRRVHGARSPRTR